MEDPSEEWEIEEENGSSEEEKTQKSGVGWILDKGISLGKKVVFTGIVISSAPLVLPPLVVISAIGFAVSVPFGFVYASYTCSEKLMSKLLPEAAPSLTLYNQKAYEEEQIEQEEEEAGDAFIGKGDLDENRSADANIREEAIRDQERELSRDEILEEVGDASIGKGALDVATLEEEERKQVRDEVENPSLVKGDIIVALERDQREQVEEVDNLLVLENPVIAKEEEEIEQGGRAENEPSFNRDGDSRNEEEKEQFGVVESEPGVKGAVEEEEKEMKEGVELVEDGSSVNRYDDAKVRDEAIINDDKEKELSIVEILEEKEDYNKNKSSDDIKIEELDKETEREPVLECNCEKSIVIGDNEGVNVDFVGDGKGSKIQPADFVESGAHKNIDNGKEEDRNDDKNGEEGNKNVPETKGTTEMEQATPLERNEEPRRISENNFEGKNMENEGVRDDSKGDSTVRPEFFAKEYKQVMSSEDTNAKLNDGVTGKEKEKGGELISNAKMTAVEIEKNDLNVREDTELEAIRGKDESVGVPTDNKQGPEMVESFGYEVTILPASVKNSKVSEPDGEPTFHEGNFLSEEKVWTQIDAVRAIIGYREQRSASMYQEVRALYLFTGVEPPPSSFKQLADLYQDLRFLMSIIGVK